MQVYLINPPFKAEHGKFSRENRSPAITRSGTFYYPLWLIYAAAGCEKDGFDVAFLDAPAAPLNEEQSLNVIREKAHDPRLFVINTSTPSIYSDIAFAERVKALYPKAYYLLVGTHPSALPEETLGISERIDAVARREYDYIVRDVARALRDGGVVSNPDMPYITDLDKIPFAAKFIREHLNHRDYFFAAGRYPAIQIFSGRGCMARCNFCVYPQTMHGHQYRLRSPENVVAEFQYIADNFPDVKEIIYETNY